MHTKSKSQTTLTLLQTKLTASVIILITFIVLITTTLTILWYAITSTLETHLSQQTEVLGNSLATQASFNTTQSILTNDLLSLNVLLTRLVANKNIISAHIYNNKDELLAEASRAPSNSASLSSNPNHKIFSSVVKFRQENVGHVIITLDKTPSQNTLSELKNLLISMGVFIAAIGLIIVFLVTRLLFAPIHNAMDALIAFQKGYRDAKLIPSFYKEGNSLQTIIRAIQKIEWDKKGEAAEQQQEEQHKVEVLPKPQIEFNFDQFFEEDKQRNCVLFIELENMDRWQKNYTQLQIANLFTPVYRAMFQSSKAYLGHVYQYNDNSAVIIFSAHECDDLLYVNAVCTAILFKGLIDNLMQSDIYFDTPEIEYKMGIDQGIPDAINNINTDEFHNIISKLKHLIKPLDSKSLVLSEEIFTLPEMQSKVFTSLPEIFTDEEGNDILSYCVRDLSKTLTKKVEDQIKKIIE